MNSRRKPIDDSKRDIEQYVRSLRLSATILRPAGFMESCASPFYGIQGGTLAEANGESYDVDIPGLRKLHPGLMTFENWLNRKGKGLFEELFRLGQANG